MILLFFTGSVVTNISKSQSNCILLKECRNCSEYQLKIVPEGIFVTNKVIGIFIIQSHPLLFRHHTAFPPKFYLSQTGYSCRCKESFGCQSPGKQFCFVNGQGPVSYNRHIALDDIDKLG